MANVPKNKMMNAATVTQMAGPYIAKLPPRPLPLTVDLIRPKMTKSSTRVTRTRIQAIEATKAEKRNPSRFEMAATRKAKKVTPAIRYPHRVSLSSRQRKMGK